VVKASGDAKKKAGAVDERGAEPFVPSRPSILGPAGNILDQALEEAGIDRADAYVTNAVKHFKWRPRGSRRLHQTPRAGEIDACRPWLDAEIKAVAPRALVAMGATAARSVFGTKTRVMRDRGRLLESPRAEIAAVTIHPSAVLRQREKRSRADVLASLVEDLTLVASALAA
jgi:DNA polymerase